MFWFYLKAKNALNGWKMVYAKITDAYWQMLNKCI